MKKTVPNNPVTFFVLFPEQNSSIHNFILFNFVVETKLFEAWSYCLQTNFIFLLFPEKNKIYVTFNGNLINISILKFI